MAGTSTSDPYHRPTRGHEIGRPSKVIAQLSQPYLSVRLTTGQNGTLQGSVFYVLLVLGQGRFRRHNGDQADISKQVVIMEPIG